MCFNNSQSKKAEQIARKYGRKTDVIEAWREIVEERRRNGEKIYDLTDGAYNIPAMLSPYSAIVTADPELRPMRWGLIPYNTKDWTEVERKGKGGWFKNAKAEKVFDTWPYKLVIEHKRCVIPSTGYFEPHYNPDGSKVPYYARVQGDEVFSIGGLWSNWTNPDTGESVESYTMITIGANELMSEVHNGGNNPYRMPFIVAEGDVQRWLDPDLPAPEIERLFRKFPAERMEAYEVPKAMWSPRNMMNKRITERVIP
ncbi:SOS response-associated peptidase [Alistipes indistinctus]|uniref:SOS response-associated peptidase n=1 Tax=Alistipes indistinctus TaxID=626932 RepID=UPI00319E849A